VQVTTTPWLLPTGHKRTLQVVGFLCSSALAVAGVGSGAVYKVGSKDALANALHLLFLRNNPVAQGICTWVSFVAVLGLLACWGLAGRYLRSFSRREVLVLAVSWLVPLLVAPPLYSGDIYAYAGQGHLVANSIDPYVYGPGDYEPTSKFSFNMDPVWRYSPAPYGPLWLGLSGLAVGIPGNHLLVSLYLLRGIEVLGFLLLAWAVPRLARTYGVPVNRALWLVLLNPLLLLHGIAGGHNDILMVGLVAAGLAVVARRPGWASLIAGTALVTLAALIKAPALAVVPFLPLLAGRRLAVSIPVAAVVVGAVAEGMALATGLGWGWIRVLSKQGEHPGLWSLAWGVRALARNAGGPGGAVDTSVRVLMLAALGVSLVAVWLLTLRGRLHPVTGAGLAMLALFVLGFSVQPWYLAWGLVPLATVVRRRHAVLLAAFSGALTLYLLPGGRNWVRPPLYGVPVLLALGLALLVTRKIVPALADRPEHELELTASA